MLRRRGGGTVDAIGAMLHRHRSNEFSVVLHINMPLRCAEPPHEVVVLSGDLSPDGVRVDGLLSHLDPQSTFWWTIERLQEAWLLIEQDALPWLEGASVPGSLIEHFEREFAREELKRAEVEGQSFLRRLTRGLTGQGASQRKGPYHQYLLWLAMLYEVGGDIERARDRLEAYASIAPLVGDERERIERHRRALAHAAAGG